MRNSTDVRVTLSEASVSMVATDGGNVYQVNRTLTLDNATDSDSGDYTCVADNLIQPKMNILLELFVRGNLNKIVYSCILKLYLSVAPSITDAPDHLTVVQPEDATFTCVATARPRPSITWWRVESDGNLTQVMEEVNVASITEMMSGERVLMSNLTIEETEACNVGNYTCVAKNEVNMKNETAVLSVLGEIIRLSLSLLFIRLCVSLPAFIIIHGLCL